MAFKAPKLLSVVYIGSVFVPRHRNVDPCSPRQPLQARAKTHFADWLVEVPRCCAPLLQTDESSSLDVFADSAAPSGPFSPQSLVGAQCPRGGCRRMSPLCTEAPWELSCQEQSTLQGS